MAAAPPGAQMADDGLYWWDDTVQQWQLVDDAPGSTGGAGPDPATLAGTAQAEHVDVAGVCQAGELTDEEIAQVLSDAGVSVAEA